MLVTADRASESATRLRPRRSVAIACWPSGGSPCSCRRRTDATSRLRPTFSARPSRRSRRRAHFYEAADIQRLLDVCDAMRDRDFELRPTMYRVLFGMIACTGLRVSEALALEVDDVTPDGLFVRETKFRKNRLVPIHRHLEEVLRRTTERPAKRRRAYTVPGPDGKASGLTTVVAAFLHLSRQLGLRGGPGEPGGRIHDLRHSFAGAFAGAVRRHDSVGLAPHATLSTYLGHAHVGVIPTTICRRRPRSSNRSQRCPKQRWSSPHDCPRTPFERPFLREHLPIHRKASEHTCDAYAYSFQLFVEFAGRRLRLRPHQLEVGQLDADMVLAFLDHLEKDRANSARTRNARLAAINAFFRYLEYSSPRHLDQVRSIRSIPVKKVDQTLVGHLSPEEARRTSLAAPVARQSG